MRKLPTGRNIPRYNVNGAKISRINLDLAARQIIKDLRGSAKLGYLCASDSHVIYQGRKNTAFMRIINESYMSTPDGMPLVWTAAMQGLSHVGRVYGPDLMLKLCELGREQNIRHYFYGSKPEILARLSKNLLTKYPGLEIVGTKSPPFRPLKPKEERQLCDEIEQLKPDLMWIGLGAPKQELFAANFQNKFAAKLLLCVGAAFDFHAGNIRQAPKWMQANGLEWLFRLLQEPKRLFKRYFLGNLSLLKGLSLQALGFKR